MFVSVEKMEKSMLDVRLDSVKDIENGINGGRCPDFEKAEFFRAYPAMLCLWPTGGGKPITIQAVENIGKFVNGYSIDYNDIDGTQHVFITLRQ